MTLPRLIVTLLSLLPASLRRRLIVALLRRFLYRHRAPTRRAPLRVRLTRGAARLSTSLGLAARAARAWTTGALARAGRAARDARLTRIDASWSARARTPVPSRALATPAPASAEPRPPRPTPPDPLRPALVRRLLRLRSDTAVKAWLVWDTPPPTGPPHAGHRSATARC